MNNTCWKIYLVSLALSGVLIAFPGAATGECTVKLEVTPDLVEINASYRGTVVEVNANLPQCDGVVITLTGSDEDIELNRKGQSAFMWLNVATVTVSNAPRIYQLLTSNELSELCSDEQLEDLGLGYAALRKIVRFESPQGLSGTEFEDFIKLKEHDGAYSKRTADILKTASDGTQQLSATLDIPSTVSPGRYEIFLYCFRDGQLFENCSKSLLIEETGFPHLLMTLAFQRSGLYGVLAVVIAIAAGFIIGFVFSKFRG